MPDPELDPLERSRSAFSPCRLFPPGRDQLAREPLPEELGHAETVRRGRCSGARILVTLLHEMRRRASTEARPYYGLATLCVGVGMGVSTVVEWAD